MNKKYLFALLVFIVFVGGYCLGKYNNSQRYIFHSENRTILDTYTGTIYFNGKSKTINQRNFKTSATKEN